MMVKLIKHIDQLAREKKRDVLMVTFDPKRTGDEVIFLSFNSDWETDENRLAFISWLEANDIGWLPSGHFASESGFRAYDGQIYLDVLFDVNDPTYQKVAGYLENEDGTLKNPRVHFLVCAFSEAMKNAHHDEPGFWEKWAETF